MASPAGQPRHPIDLDALSSYLQKHMSQVKLPIEINQFEYGQRFVDQLFARLHNDLICPRNYMRWSHAGTPGALMQLAQGICTPLFV
ncbi:hypothetical protein, variant [Puccinia striiformis f. sp. tritici PST-78]|uniref:Uncharacterized protein n=1 Tax=Puccinia striiformis f. sp. tritici PST-78 TaxID=1165861 RepID=A0A0L0VJD6_9BASI|nr:hypothetical protein PSTG_07314 [Puccinia striiformis f. sp. tritici PST-78]KNE99383.1 hypothetical protein, variant [Puccinia striiformis f. sp. tritici PST-78]